MIAASLCLAYLGFFALSLAMDRHHEQVFARRPSAARRRAMTLGGWGALALSPFPSVAAWGWSIGIAGWFGLLTVAATALAMLLPYAPRAALAFGIASPVAALLPVLVPAAV